MKEALHIQLKVLPTLSDKNPIIGPPATPPISNKVDNSPDSKDVYPRESFRYKGSQR